MSNILHVYARCTAFLFFLPNSVSSLSLHTVITSTTYSPTELHYDYCYNLVHFSYIIIIKINNKKMSRIASSQCFQLDPQ